MSHFSHCYQQGACQSVSLGRLFFRKETIHTKKQRDSFVTLSLSNLLPQLQLAKYLTKRANYDSSPKPQKQHNAPTRKRSGNNRVLLKKYIYLRELQEHQEWRAQEHTTTSGKATAAPETENYILLQVVIVDSALCARSRHNTTETTPGMPTRTQLWLSPPSTRPGPTKTAPRPAATAGHNGRSGKRRVPRKPWHPHLEGHRPRCKSVYIDGAAEFLGESGHGRTATKESYREREHKKGRSAVSAPPYAIYTKILSTQTPHP